MTTNRAARRRQDWVAALTLIAASVLQLTAVAGRDPLTDPTALIAAVLGTAGLVVVIRFATAGCFESRIAMTLLSAASVLGIVLMRTIGLPGSEPGAWVMRDAALIALAASTALALWGVRASEPASAYGLWSRRNAPVAGL